MNNKKFVVMESIHFQSTAFFEELSNQIKTILSEKFLGNNVQLYSSTNVLKLLDIISDYTGIKLKYGTENPLLGPFIITPSPNFNHIFIPNSIKDAIYENGAISEDYLKLTNPVFKGTINLKEAKVDGDFCNIENILYIPASLLRYGVLFNKELTVKEIAAILLHEIGHAFIGFEYAARVSRTNQVLTSIVEAMHEKSSDKFEIAMVKADSILELDAKQKEALKNVNTEQGAGIVLITTAIDKSVRELGYSVFDENSCEQLADQFSARFGAAKDLMTAMSKLETDRLGNSKEFYGREILTGVFITITSLFPPLALFYLYLSYVCADKQMNLSRKIYGSFHTRMSRLRNEMIQRLKDKSISTKERDEILSALKVADDIVANEMDKLTFIESIGYLLNPKFRSDHKYEVLQKQLESLAHNPLFAQAAKLSTLTDK